MKRNFAVFLISWPALLNPWHGSPPTTTSISWPSNYQQFRRSQLANITTDSCVFCDSLKVSENFGMYSTPIATRKPAISNPVLAPAPLNKSTMTEPFCHAFTTAGVLNDSSGIWMVRHLEPQTPCAANLLWHGQPCAIQLICSWNMYYTWTQVLLKPNERFYRLK